MLSLPTQLYTIPKSWRQPYRSIKPKILLDSGNSELGHPNRWVYIRLQEAEGSWLCTKSIVCINETVSSKTHVCQLPGSQTSQEGTGSQPKHAISKVSEIAPLGKMPQCPQTWTDHGSEIIGQKENILVLLSKWTESKWTFWLWSNVWFLNSIKQSDLGYSMLQYIGLDFSHFHWVPTFIPAMHLELWVQRSSDKQHKVSGNCL